MNPDRNILPPMSNNELLRRLGFVFMDANGNLKPGAPGGPVAGKKFAPAIRVQATGPAPAQAILVVAEDKTRVGGLLRNTDGANPIVYGSDPDVTDAGGGGVLGGTLNAGESVPIAITGPIYAYAPNGGAPWVEFLPVLNV